MSETNGPPADDKYIVFKRVDWFSKVQDMLGTDNLQRIGTYAMDDAAVIRLSDVFAATALFNYSNQVLTTLEILISFADEEDTEMGLILEKLQDVADHFHQLGVYASSHDTKLPD